MTGYAVRNVGVYPHGSQALSRRILLTRRTGVAPGESMGVLVVDESDVFLASALHWIDSRPDLHFAGVARSGQEALDAVESRRPDIVIVECVMHGVDGFRLVRELKARDPRPFVLLVTFHANQAAREEALAAGADAFLAKYDLYDGFDPLLRAWRAAGSRTPVRPARRESQNVPEP